MVDPAAFRIDALFLALKRYIFYVMNAVGGFLTFPPHFEDGDGVSQH